MMIIIIIIITFSKHLQGDQIIYPDYVLNEAGVTQRTDYRLIQNVIKKKTEGQK